MKRFLTFLILFGLLAPVSAWAQLSTPQKISATTGDARGNADIGLNFRFGSFSSGALSSMVNAGDVDGDGIDDVAMTINFSVWILFMNADGTVRTYRKTPLIPGAGGNEWLGSVAPLGDFDGDGVPDLITGAYTERIGEHVQILYLNRDGTAKNRKTVCERNQEPFVPGVEGERGESLGWGACYVAAGKRPVDIDGDGVNEHMSYPNGITITFLKANGDVRRFQHICNFMNPDDTVFPYIPVTCRQGGFTGEGPAQGFGFDAISSMGDLDGNGVPDLAVGGAAHPDGCETYNCTNGVVWILFMNADGTVKRHQKIGRTDGGFSGALRDSVYFGYELTTLEDFDGDGVPELAVDAPGHFEQRTIGQVWILFMNADGTVEREQKITQGEGGFTGIQYENDYLGLLLASLGDIDDDPETVETLVAAATMVPADTSQPHVGGQGALWFLFLKKDGTVKRDRMMRSTDFLFYPNSGDHFGQVLTPLGDLDGDGVEDLAAGTPENDDSGEDVGTVWILFLNADGTLKRHQKINATWGSFTGTLDDGDRFGASLARLGEAGSDGVTLAVGAPGDDDGGVDRGAVWVLDLNHDGTVRAYHKISQTTWGGALGDDDQFGAALAALDDLDGDGLPGLAVGAPFDDEAGADRGAVYVLHLGEDSSVGTYEKVPGGERIHFGASLTDLGAQAGERVLAVGAHDDSSPAGSDAALWIVRLSPDGVLTRQRQISPDEVGVASFTGSPASLGDLDGDGLSELALGTSTDATEGMTLLFLNAEDGVKTAPTRPSFDAAAPTGFGRGLASLGDLDDDGIPDLAIGAPLNDDGGSQRGALWLTSLRELLRVAIEPPEANPTVPTFGQDVTISTQITDLSGKGLTEASLYFHRGGDTNFFRAQMQEQTPGLFQATIPALANGERGVEYYVEATNALDLTTRSPATGAISVPVYVPEGLRHPLHAGSAASAYRLISVPLDLDEKSARALLEDDLGPYDRKTWRFFRPRGENQFTELGQVDMQMAPGQAYWLIVKDPGHELTTGAGTSVRTDVPFRIPLDPGWNLVSSPFSFAVPVANTRTDDGQAVEFLHYAGDWALVDSMLLPFEGYAVFSAQADTLLIFPNASLQAVSTQSSLAKRAEALDWSIRILAWQGEARDTHTYAAVAEGASTGWDALDRAEPPAVGDYVRVSFPHPEWKRRAAHYSTDVRPAPEREERWAFEVETRRSGVVELRFEGVASVPSQYGVWLVDEAVGVRRDLRREPGYAVVSGGGGQGRSLTLVVGPSGEQEMIPEVPSRLELFGNFPNPFRGATTIRYGLPESSEVRLEVFDVLGRRVVVLVSGAVSAGYHGVVWDGRSESGMPVGSGLYVVRLRAGRSVQTRPMVLVR